METLLKHKGFIEMVARDIIRPDESQQVVKDVLEAYSKIDNTAEILVGCSTCANKFKDTFKIILAYINSIKLPVYEMKLDDKSGIESISLVKEPPFGKSEIIKHKKKN